MHGTARSTSGSPRRPQNVSLEPCETPIAIFGYLRYDGPIQRTPLETASTLGSRSSVGAGVSSTSLNILDSCGAIRSRPSV